MVGVIVLGLWQFVTDPSAYTAHPPPTPSNLHDVIVASTVAIFAMLGVECATIPAGKVKDPARTIPRATMVGTILTALVYIAISLIPLLLIPQAELAVSNAPFSDLFERFLGGGSARLLAVFVIISGLGALNGWTLVVGEVTQNFAKRGNFPRVLARVNARGAPTYAFLLTGAVASIMLLANYNQAMVNIFTFRRWSSRQRIAALFSCARGAGVVEAGNRRPLAEATLFLAAVFASAYCLWAFIGVATKEGTASLLWAVALAAFGVVVYVWSLISRRRDPAGSRVGT
jgi:APA family basic amino acid/polyamine antiporter